MLALGGGWNAMILIKCIDLQGEMIEKLVFWVKNDIC